MTARPRLPAASRRGLRVVAAPPPALGAHLGFVLRGVANFVQLRSRQTFAAHGATVAEWVALRSLYDDGGVSIAALVRAMGMTGGAVSRLVERLVHKGLVQHDVSTRDRRAAVLRLTPRGRGLVRRLTQHAIASDATTFGTLSCEERATLAALLQRLATAHGLPGRAAT